MSTYASIKSLHSTLPSYSPVVPTSLLPYIALITLTLFFALTFGFTTLPKRSNPVSEVGIAGLASILAGGGVVALFCTLGVHV